MGRHQSDSQQKILSWQEKILLLSQSAWQEKAGLGENGGIYDLQREECPPQTVPGSHQKKSPTGREAGEAS